VAAGIRLALESEACLAEVLNLGESRTWSMGLWARHVLEAAGSEAELTRVPDVLLPDDLKVLGTISQHLLVDSSKARDLLGWTETDPHEAVARSVAWHLANPPQDADADFGADDRALAAAG
jgi:nucleoside-diphosphate-sugar epimerase